MTEAKQSSDVPYKGNDVFLYFSVLCVTLNSFVTGAVFTWTSPVLPKLKGDYGPESNPLTNPITSSEEALIASLINIGGAISPFLGGPLVNSIGRKRSLLLLGVLIIIGYLVLAFAAKVELFYFGRFLVGIGAGSSFFLVPMFITEVSKPSNRGLLGCIMGVVWRLGTFSSFVIGPYTSVQTFSLICLIPFIIFYVLFGFFVPDTPHYYILKNNVDAAEQSLRKFRGGADVKEELAQITENVQQSIANKRTFLELFKSKVLLKGLAITLGLMFFQQFTGITVLLSYTQSIFDATSSTIPPEIASMIVGAVYPIACIIATQIVDRIGRRFLLLSSLGGVAVSVGSIGTYFLLQSSGHNVDPLFWLPVLSLVLVSFFHNLGIGPLAWTILGELFAPDVKALASVLTTFVCLMLAFVTSQLFPIMVEIIGIGSCFLIFAIVSVIGIVFVALVVPETKGKTLVQIQNELRGKTAQ